MKLIGNMFDISVMSLCIVHYTLLDHTIPSNKIWNTISLTLYSMHDIYNIKSITRDILCLDRPVTGDAERYIWDQWWVHVLHIDGQYVTVRTGWLKLSPWDNISLRYLDREIKEQALRYNSWKTRWSLVHFPSLEPLVEVLEFGAMKYAEDNWKKPMDKKQILNSMQRHIIRLMEDEELDSESNLKHIGHIMANCMMYSWHTNPDNFTHKK